MVVHLMCSRTKVAACAKHFVGDGGTTKGIDQNNTVISVNGLFDIHIPAYIDSVLKGVSTIMVSYSSWNGMRMHANRALITGFLKGKLKFRVKEQLSFMSYWSKYSEEIADPHIFCYLYLRVLSYQIGRQLTRLLNHLMQITHTLFKLQFLLDSTWSVLKD